MFDLAKKHIGDYNQCVHSAYVSIGITINRCVCVCVL